MTVRIRSFFLLSFMGGLIFSVPALAVADFCLAGYGLAPQCVYADIAQCIKDSDPPSTSCVVNPEARLNYLGGAPYCVVNSSLSALCMYVDRSQCNSQAGIERGICIQRENMILENDPFRYDPRVQN